MKLVLQTSQSELADAAVHVLRENGIPACKLGQDLQNMGVFTGGSTLRVFVFFDEQYEDAEKLLKNPDYVVRNPMSEEEILAFEASMQKAIAKSSATVFNVTAVLVFLGLATFFVLRVLFS